MKMIAIALAAVLTLTVVAQAAGPGRAGTTSIQSKYISAKTVFGR